MRKKRRIISTLPPQKVNIPGLYDGERIILQAQGGYCFGLRTGWKVAHCFLTNQRFLICWGRITRFEISLADIQALTIENHYYVLRIRKTICLAYRNANSSKKSKIRFIVNDFENWKGKIHQASILKLDIDTVQRIAAHLDHEGREILWYLWFNRHARINRLAELIDAPDHMHVLFNIREIINPIAQKMVDSPILVFERSKMDPDTGETVLFSWWLIGRREKREVRHLDIYDEGDHIRIVMALRGMGTSDLRLEVEKDRLTLRAEKSGSVWKKMIDLPASINADHHRVHLKNDFLDIKLPKSGQELSRHFL